MYNGGSMTEEKPLGAEYFVATDHLIDGLLLGLRNPYAYAAEKTSLSENKIRTMSKNPALDTIIKKKLKTILDASDVDKVQVLNEIKKIAFSNIKDVLTVRTVNEDTGNKDFEENPILVQHTKVKYKDWKDLDDSVTAAIAEVSQSSQGIKVKLHSKMTALESLTKILEMTTSKLELSGSVDTGQRLFDGYKPSETGTSEEDQALIEGQEEIDNDNPL